MRWRTWKEARFDICCNIAIPIAGGAAGALRGSEWYRLYQYLFVENVNWTICVFVWLFMSGFICLMAGGTLPKQRKIKRIVGVIVVTLWVWGVTISAAMYTPQPPVFQQHIYAPNYWWRGGKN